LLDFHSGVPEVSLSLMFWSTNLDPAEYVVKLVNLFVINVGEMGQISSIIVVLVALTFPVSYL